MEIEPNTDSTPSPDATTITKLGSFSSATVLLSQLAGAKRPAFR